MEIFICNAVSLRKVTQISRDSEKKKEKEEKRNKKKKGKSNRMMFVFKVLYNHIGLKS